MRPLLRGALAAAAYERLDALSRAFIALAPAKVGAASLAEGSAGIALAHAYLARVFPERGHEGRASAMLRHAFAVAARTSLAPSLFHGFVGIAWVVEHLAGGDTAARNAQIDEALASLLAAPRWRASYGLADGLAGIAVYALEAAPRDEAIAILARVVEHLSASAQRAADGVAWINEPRWSPKPSPRRHFDLGLAHGLSGVVPVLAACAALGVETAEARPLVAGSVRWLLAQRLPARGGDSSGRFPRAIGRDFSADPAPLAWAEGDLGIASTLLLAARALRVSRWEKEAVALALRATKRALNDGRDGRDARDARNAGDAGDGPAHAIGLAHGAAGVAHLFHRFYRLTGDARFAVAARAAFARLIVSRVFDAGRARKSARATILPKPRSAPDASLLTGTAGAALALVTALADDAAYFAWDRAILPRTDLLTSARARATRA